MFAVLGWGMGALGPCFCLQHTVLLTLPRPRVALSLTCLSPAHHSASPPPRPLSSRVPDVCCREGRLVHPGCAEGTVSHYCGVPVFLLCAHDPHPDSPQGGLEEAHCPMPSCPGLLEQLGTYVGRAGQPRRGSVGLCSLCCWGACTDAKPSESTSQSQPRPASEPCWAQWLSMCGEGPGE